MAPFKVHTVRFYQPEPKSIHAMALNGDGKLLALSRSDSSLEIWDVEHLPVFLKCIPPPPDVQIECVSWYYNRLFTAGLDGFLHEQDIQMLDIKQKYMVNSGPAWCIAVSVPNKQVAVGTEEGYVNIFNILNNSLEFHKILDKQEGRILCLAWHPRGLYLATGSIGTIRVWSPKSGHPIARMTPGRVERKKETIVWSLAMTDDCTVISGDSNGQTTFWNGELGTHVFGVKSHAADVLTVELNTSGTMAFASGVDPTVMHFQLIRKQDGTRKWVKSLHRKLGDHDVRCLAPYQESYFSGGVDSMLTFSNFTAKSVSRIPPLPVDGVLQLAGQTGLCILKFRSRLELWRLGETDQETGAVNTNLPLAKEPVRILQLNTRDEEMLVSSAIDPTGKYIAYTTRSFFRILELKWDVEEGVGEGKPGKLPTLQKIKITNNSDMVPHCLHFFQIGDQTSLMCGYGVSRLEVFHLTGGGPAEASWRLDANQLQMPPVAGIRRICVAGSTAVVADFFGHIVAIDLKSETVISKLPTFAKASISSIAISPDERTCTVVYGDQSLMQVDIQTARFTQFSNAFQMSSIPEWKSRRSTVIGSYYIKPQLMLLHDYQNLIIIDEEREISEPEEKIHISEANHDDSQDGSFTCSSPTYSTSTVKTAVSSNQFTNKLRIHPAPNLIAAQPFNANTIVCVELSLDQIEAHLPPSLKVKKFGAQ